MMTTPHLGEAGPHPVVASAARELLNKSENEPSGVISPYSQTIGNADALSPVVERARLPPEARVTRFALRCRSPAGDWGCSFARVGFAPPAILTGKFSFSRNGAASSGRAPLCYNAPGHEN